MYCEWEIVNKFENKYVHLINHKQRDRESDSKQITWKKLVAKKSTSSSDEYPPSSSLLFPGNTSSKSEENFAHNYLLCSR